jgi:hypothetical protein
MDGGEGNFVWRSGVATDNDGTIITATGGYWERADATADVDPRWFGAVLNGSTNTLTQLQAAVAAAALRPNKTVRISGPMAITTASGVIAGGVTLRFEDGGYFTGAGMSTLTINANIDAGPYQIFTAKPLAFTGKVTPYACPEHLGAVGNGVAADHVAFQNAWDTFKHLKLVPGKRYNFINYLNAIYVPIGSTLEGWGAELMEARLYIPPGWGNAHIRGLKMRSYANSQPHHFVTVYGSNATFEDIDMEKIPAAGGKWGIMFGVSSNCKFTRFRSVGSNGFDPGGKNHIFSDFEVVGEMDDCFAFPSDDNLGGSQTENIVIQNGIVRRCSAIASFGTGIGTTINHDQPYGTYYVKNVHISNVVAIECTQLIYVKPGLIYDHRNGVLKDCTFSSLSIQDPVGDEMQTAIVVNAANGATVDNLSFRDITMRGRCKSAGFYRFGASVSCHPTGAPATIKNIFFDGFRVIDEEGGVPDGVGTAYPIDSGFFIENQIEGDGTIENIQIRNCMVEGANRFAVYVGPGLDGAVKVYDNDFKGLSHAASADQAGFWTYSDGIEFKRNKVAVINNKPIGSTSATIEDVEYEGERVTLPFGTHAVFTEPARNIWTAPNDCYVHKIEVINASTIPQHAANYCQLAARNVRTNNLFASNTTQPGGMNIVAHTPTRILPVNHTSADAYLRKGDIVRFHKYAAGTDQPLDDMIVIIHYLEY